MQNMNVQKVTPNRIVIFSWGQLDDTVPAKVIRVLHHSARWMDVNTPKGATISLRPKAASLILRFKLDKEGEWFNAEWGNRESVSLCAGETRKTLGLKANRRNFTLYVTPICPH
jgi:hypothetical protein